MINHSVGWLIESMEIPLKREGMSSGWWGGWWCRDDDVDDQPFYWISWLNEWICTKILTVSLSHSLSALLKWWHFFTRAAVGCRDEGDGDCHRRSVTIPLLMSADDGWWTQAESIGNKCSSFNKRWHCQNCNKKRICRWWSSMALDDCDVGWSSQRVN